MAALNYNHLRYFWAVAHEGNLTRTAEKLHAHGLRTVAQRFNQLERKQKRDYGQESWWRRGDAAPRRAPDLGAAFGGQ